MANTTNFGWETPDDTDLVKDGAAAIRTLGQAIDTSLMDLEGGTTDQVLAKNSNADMDFKWVTSDDANAIQNAIVDAKGDIVAASANDTPARLAVGTDNHRLVAASGETTGLKYVADTQNTVIDAAGDLVYGTAADTLGRLAIGTAGQVLKVNSGATAPEWATASTGALTKITSASFTTASDVAVDGCFTSTYTKYKVIYQCFSSVADADLQFQWRYSTGTTQTTDYYGSGQSYNRQGTLVAYNSDNTSQLTFNTRMQSSAAETTFGEITFALVGNASENPQMVGMGNNSFYTGWSLYAGTNNTARTYTGFLLKPDSGTITGSYAVYGYQN